MTITRITGGGGAEPPEVPEKTGKTVQNPLTKQTISTEVSDPTLSGKVNALYSKNVEIKQEPEIRMSLEHQLGDIEAHDHQELMQKLAAIDRETASLLATLGGNHG